MGISAILRLADHEIRILRNPWRATEPVANGGSNQIDVECGINEEIQILAESGRAMRQMKAAAALEYQIARHPASRRHQGIQRRDV
ncbi:MAG: hypothetical protein AMXMBFR76_21580 [Pseudomonadota bacterium]